MGGGMFHLFGDYATLHYCYHPCLHLPTPASAGSLRIQGQKLGRRLLLGRFASAPPLSQLWPNLGLALHQMCRRRAAPSADPPPHFICLQPFPPRCWCHGSWRLRTLENCLGAPLHTPGQLFPSTINEVDMSMGFCSWNMVLTDPCSSFAISSAFVIQIVSLLTWPHQPSSPWNIMLNLHIGLLTIATDLQQPLPGLSDTWSIYWRQAMDLLNHSLPPQSAVWSCSTARGCSIAVRSWTPPDRLLTTSRHVVATWHNMHQC